MGVRGARRRGRRGGSSGAADAFAKPQAIGGGFPGVFERVAGGEFGAGDLDFAAHGAGDVVFVVEAVGNERDGAAGDDLADEDDAAADFVADDAAHVVAEVDFGEAGVAGDGQAEEAHVFEAEADDADVGLAVVEIGFGAGRREALDDFGRHGEVEQQQVAPVGG